MLNAARDSLMICYRDCLGQEEIVITLGACFLGVLYHFYYDKILVMRPTITLSLTLVVLYSTLTGTPPVFYRLCNRRNNFDQSVLTPVIIFS